LPDKLSASKTAAADSVLTSGRGAAYGARNLLRLWRDVRELAAWPPLNAALRQTLGPQAGLVRGLFFDKPPGATWSLPWHRDQTIAVRRHVPSARFVRPTVKAGTPHVQAPSELLEQMLTARIHLDAMTGENGPLRVISGSHQTLAEPEDCAGEQVELHCPAGSVLLMRPLLLHASSPSAAGAGHRRIVHLEFAPRPTFEDGFEWHDFVPL
jgi:ectoine hydroxylase-related dioxygenase (phytanoyl-CoA dioxygenase family)